MPLFRNFAPHAARRGKLLNPAETSPPEGRRPPFRTLHLTNSWHAASGGIGTFYRALLEAATREGWQARLVVPSNETRYEPVGGFAGIYHVRGPRAPFSPDYRVLYPHHYLLPGGAVRDILQREQPHLVEVCDKYTLPYLGGMLRSGLLTGAAGRPAVVGLSCERMDRTLSAYLKAGTLAKAFAAAYMKWLYFPLFDHHVAVSRPVADELESAARGHKVSRGVWIRGMGVDAERFHPRRKSAVVRQRLALAANATGRATLLLYAGRLAPEKNLRLLLDLLDALKPGGDHRLLIAGDGPLRGEFLAEAEHRHPGTVIYLGHILDREPLADLMANADIFLHPNPSEPYGIAPLEAMAAGVPLIAPDSGGVGAYANADNAWVVPATAEAFAAAVRSIRGNPEERVRKAREARAAAERRAWPVVSAGFLSLYRELYARVRHPEGAGNEEPAFYSTRGNWFGVETSTLDSANGASERSGWGQPAG